MKNEQNATMIEVDIDLDAQDFNGFVGREAFRKLLKKYNLELNYVDLDCLDHWINRYDTAVFILEAGAIFDFGSFIHEIKPDEFHRKIVNGEHVIRLWWD